MYSWHSMHEAVRAADLPITRPLRGGKKTPRLDTMYGLLLSGNFSPSMQAQVGAIVKGMTLAAQGGRR